MNQGPADNRFRLRAHCANEPLRQATEILLITKSNSIRRSAKERSAEVTAVDEQLKQKLQELKNNE